MRDNDRILLQDYPIGTGQWCGQNQVMPFAARPEDIALFVDYTAQRSSLATASRRIRTIGNILQLRFSKTDQWGFGL